MTEPLELYKHHAARYQHLLETPLENLGTYAARKEHMICMTEEQEAMKRHAKRLTYDQKKELGLLNSQINSR